MNGESSAAAEASSSSSENTTLQKKAVLARFIPWEGYQRMGIIKTAEYELINEYDRKDITEEQRKQLLAKNGLEFARLFLAFVKTISVNDPLQYIVTLIHEMLLADPKRAELFQQLSQTLTGEEYRGYPYQPFFSLLGGAKKDMYVAKLACAILGIFMTQLSNVPVDIQDHFFGWIKDHLRVLTQETHLALYALQCLFAKNEYRLQFFKAGDTNLLVHVLRTQTQNFQLIYETIYCAWLMTYNEYVANNVNDTDLIPALVDVIKTISKEKVIRLTLATLSNLAGKSSNNQQMIESGFLRMLAILQNKKWGDEDIVADLTKLSDSLGKNIVEMSSFDIYRKEVMTGQLEWSPVHKSEKFWRENQSRFEENDYQVLQKLRMILRTSTDITVLSVACYDIGEFVRFHPRGKEIVQQTGLKPEVMELLKHENEDVKKQALFSVQKMLVNNWQYLAK
eukprot:TRINITY_DN223_c0_g1_i1.p1 TRINITY_DN223_c0_g1~~TRINITY_DN223_c0_g1_i1.p1  ORF type:complete len:452 (-),score=109.78 TRINITY_DN223_c0_g1_i1:84-1439(-)